jgi:peptidoglycan/LPS O-acetylase OafA/YrhL
MSTAPKFIKLTKKLLMFIMLSFFITIILTNFEGLSRNFFVERWSFTAGGNIAMGALLATLLSDKEVEVKIKPFLSWFGSLVVGVILIFSEVWLDGTNQLVAQYLRCIGFTILIGWIVLNQNSKLTRALEIAPLSYLGKISYGIYMYQGFFLSTGPYRAPNQTWPPNQDIGLILLILVTPLSYHYFEKPIMSLKQKLQRVPTDKSSRGSTIGVCHDSDKTK